MQSGDLNPSVQVSISFVIIVSFFLSRSRIRVLSHKVKNLGLVQFSAVPAWSSNDGKAFGGDWDNGLKGPVLS